jgi:hypothetical protein
MDVLLGQYISYDDFATKAIFQFFQSLALVPGWVLSSTRGFAGPRTAWLVFIR